MKPRIAILHYSCYPVIGGVETVIEAHAGLFLNHGYKVKVVVGEGSQFNKNVPVKVIPGLFSMEKKNQVIDSELKKSIVSKKFYKRAEKIYKRLKKELKDSDIVIVHNVLTMHLNMPFTLALQKIIKENNHKFVAWCHDMSFEYLLDVSKKNIFPYNRLAQYFDNVKYVTISELRRRQLAKLLSIKKELVTKVPNGIFLNFYGVKRITWEVFNFFNLFEQNLVLLTPSRVLKRKNLELGVRVVKELNKKIKTKLIITGSHDPHNKDSIDYYKSLLKLVKDLDLKEKVIFLSRFRNNGKQIYITTDILKDLFLLSDMVLFPSTQEGFGIPLIEAGIINKPVMCSNIEPFKEIGKKDLLYFNLDESPKDIADRIFGFYKENLKGNVSKKVIKKYAWENIFKKQIRPLIESIK